jgi:tetratricopeptide (TPR) repeat protein
LQELRAARKDGLLTSDVLHPQELAEQTAAFARFSDPQSLIDGEGQIIDEMAQELKEARYINLAVLITQRPSDDRPLLVIAARYFFRRAVEENAKLFQGLAFAQLERLGKEQEEGFASLHALMSQQGQRLEDLLANVQTKVIQTHSAVLDLKGQIEGQSGQLQEIGDAVQKLLEQHQLQRREVRAGDSLSIRNEGERQLVKQLVARYRSLPQGERQNVPALLNAIGKLEVVAGEFDQAQRDFQQVATMVDDTKAQAEAHFNAYQTALERRDLNAALKEFIEAVKLDAKRYAPFPVGEYHPLRILGAGGFGTAYLCRHKYMNADVVVKALHLDALGRDTDKVFTEAQVLRQLDHPAIIRISECGYVNAASKGRPHIIMDYFQGRTLESYVKEHGPLSVEDVLVVARQVAEGLQAAHGARILHRDVKPANLLVRKEATGWKVKIIDFGLAMPQKVVETSRKASTFKQKETMIGSSIAGTLDYGAPEQMGKRKESVGFYSDVYGWGKTCCYALFQTTQPLLKHWSSLPRSLAELLEKCLEEDPKQRPATFAEVLKGLDSGGGASTPALLVSEPGFDFERPEREVVAAPRAKIATTNPRRGCFRGFSVAWGCLQWP